jgi:hypothetical protein
MSDDGVHVSIADTHAPASNPQNTEVTQQAGTYSGIYYLRATSQQPVTQGTSEGHDAELGLPVQRLNTPGIP